MKNVPIQVSNISKQFGDVRALDNVSLSVAQGEMFGLIGHNGAGKSTLFKLMLGLIAPSSGTISINGALAGNGNFRDVRRRIGYLPENFVTYDNLTGLEVLHLFADLKRVPREECAPVLDSVGLGHAMHRRVRGYSKGMRQRLGFAQVLVGKPDLIFLDEPTNGLDAEGIHEFYRVLRDAQSRGATIIITSHILAEIQERVDRLVILSGGKITAEGTLAQLRSQLVLPSTIEASVQPDCLVQVREALAALSDVTLQIETGTQDDVVKVYCPAARKIDVLHLLTGMRNAVRDIVVHEPTLEDLFFGYGGEHD
ncbi:ABC transporter ATP-binding protein [Noviherbaspirillum agri]